MPFSDIHTHILYKTDDGAKTREEMFELVGKAYEHGTRLLCATPHFHPGYFGDNREEMQYAFAVLSEYCKEKYPDLTLVLGNELFYTHDSISWMKNNLCIPMGNTRYVLTEFSVDDSEDYIAEGILRLLNIGYIPIIAHAERYRKLSMGRLWALRQNGVLVQVNSQSLDFSPVRFMLKKRSVQLLDEKLVDFISSDAHDVSKRPPLMQNAYDCLLKKYGNEYAEQLCYSNAVSLFGNNINAEDGNEQ